MYPRRSGLRNDIATVNNMPEEQTPLERIEQLSDELLTHYGGGQDPELRVAAKLLMVALDLFRRHGDRHWAALVREYLQIAERNPARFDSILRSNRSEKSRLAKSP